MLYISDIISREHRKLANSNNGSVDVVISELGLRVVVIVLWFL